jgi:hypothetical protein
MPRFVLLCILLQIMSQNNLIQDTFDLFATFVISLRLTTHTQYFRRFPNSFKL